MAKKKAKIAVNTNEAVLANLAKRFSDDMEQYGYRVYPEDDRWMPSLDCRKDGHYRIKAICFLDPSSKSFSVSGTVGIDVRSVFYYSIKEPFDNLDARYESMMAKMEQYILKELWKEKEDRQEF